MNDYPEILAPVGNEEMFEAAKAARADAVYLSAKQFGARAYAENFDNAQLQDIILDAHLHGMKVYLTMNTAVKQTEFVSAVEQAKKVYEMGCDAVIVQDIGFACFLHEMIPELVLHGSTQMSVTGLSGALFLEKIGLKRIVLGREVSIEEVERILSQTNLEVELFVHGSLCVSISGQCYMSFFAGGRSGNRGQCAQPCRKTYRLLKEDGSKIGEDTFLSPRDLSTITKIGQLASMGVHSLKIEGRMKKPEYVFATVTAYQKALRGASFSVEEMQLTTNRPFTQGFLFHDFGKQYAYSQQQETGEKIGKVEVRREQKFVSTDKDLHVGDSIRLIGRRGTFLITLTEKQIKNGEITLSDFPDLKMHSPVYRVYSSKAKEDLLKQTQIAKEEKLPIQISIRVYQNEEIQVVVNTLPEQGDFVVQRTGEKAHPAASAPLDKERIQKAMQRLGNTPFCLKEITVDTDGKSFVPVSSLNALRREVLDCLLAKLSWNGYEERREKARFFSNTSEMIKDWKEKNSMRLLSAKSTTGVLGKSVKRSERESSPTVWIELAEREAFEEALSRLAGRNVCWILSCQMLAEFSSLKKSNAAHQVYLGFPSLMEEEQYTLWKEWIAQNEEKFDGFYLQSLNDLGAVMRMEEENIIPRKKKIGGMGLNVFNTFSADMLLKWGIELLTPSMELTAIELEAFSGYPTMLFVYGRIPVMQMRHCPASMIKGCLDDTKCQQCGFRHKLYLQDAFGKREVVRKDRYSEVLLPEIIDMRDASHAVRNLRPNALLMIHRGEQDISEIYQFWVQQERKQNG